MSSRTLIRGGWVLTLGPRTPNYATADVLIEDGRIVEVGPGLRARGADHIDAIESIVMPGFVDTHRHAWRSLFRNFGEGATVGDQPLTPEAYGPHYRPNDVYAAILIGLLGALESGITTVVDWSDVGADDEFAGAALQAHADSGLRTVFVHGTPKWVPEARDSRDSLTSILERPHSDATTIAAGSQNPSGPMIDDLAVDWAHARQAGARIHVHAGTTPDDRGAVATLGQRGLLSGDVTLVHCSHLGGADLDAVGSHGTRVSITPASEMAGGLGSPPIQQLLDRNIRPGLGVDDELVTPGDMFAQMRAIDSIQHATMFDLKLAGKAGLSTLLSTRDVIRFATIDGANTAGLGDVTGSIQVGKQADIIILRADRPNIAPINDPIGAVVWGMDTSNLDWVLVGGEPRMREGKLVADVENVRRLATEAQRRVAGAAGLLTGVRSGG